MKVHTGGGIGLLCQHFYPEMISTGIHMTELATALTRHGWKITVYCAQPSLSLEDTNPRVPRELEYQGVRVVRVPSIGSHRGAVAGRLLFALTYLLGSLWAVIIARRNLSGLIITTNPPFLALVGVLAAKLLGLPYILIIYDVYPEIAIRLGVLGSRSFIARLWERLARLMLNCSSVCVVIGRDMADVITPKLKRENRAKVRLIRNWCNEETIRPVYSGRNSFRQAHRLEGYLVVQYSGRLGQTHNLEPLIEAAGILRDGNVIFQFIGDGTKKRILQRKAAEMGLTNVQFLPYQPLSHLDEVLSAADIAVVCLETAFTGLSVPSKSYGIMASAKPILAFLDPKSEIGRMVSEHQCGIVLPDPTGNQVAASIQEWRRQPELLLAMGANGRRAFEQHYTLSRSAKEYSEICENVFGGDHP